MRYFNTGWLLLLVMAVAACGRKKGQPRQQEIVQNIRQLDEVVAEQVRERLEYVAGNEGMMEDSVAAFRLSALQYAYRQHGVALWSKNGRVGAEADTMLQWINAAGNYGLNPAHYHATALNDVQSRFRTEKDAQKDAALWAKMDVLLTDAFFKMSHHLHYGVAPRDSVTLRKDSLLSDTVLTGLLQTALQQKSISAALQQQEPFHPGYLALKEGLLQFRRRFGDMRWDTLPQQYADTLQFRQQLAARLIKTGQLDSAGFTDSVQLKNAVRKFQREYNLYADGIAGKRTIEALNKQPQDWLLQASVNLDRWRKLPDTLPGRYLLVNIPAFRLNVMEDTASVVESRVIVGTPRTRTPILNSVMTNFVLYPYWRVPYSIVFKEMLPQIKKNVGYLAEKNLEVVDHHGNVVNPDSINWGKLGRRYFPYVLRQMDGLDNSLGILKFNFANKFSVYLHDTNNRSLFSNSNRALSHGCVRVQAWDSLAMYMIRNDPRPEMRDSVLTWLQNEEQRVYSMTNRLPIYIRYFTAEMRNGRLQFYDDVYGEDSTLERYFR